ncbi:MAG: hypothetical protein IAE89_01485 [Anaerolineae bacterium]|nr:hypothetical protein [Anaerolineae bacterium]
MRKISFTIYAFCLLALVVLLLGVIPPAFAQTSPLLWVRFYEDVNENALLDAGEPLITQGMLVQLLNQDGVIVASALLDDVPTASQGLIGFQDIMPGEYTVLITSADFSPTGDSQFARTILEGGVPVLVEYGAKAAIVESENMAAAQRGLFGLPIYLGNPEQVARIAVALLIGQLAAMVMIALGIVIYVFMRRRYLRQLRDLKRQAATSGQIAQVNIPPGKVF